jgi:hypothetical protein
MEVGFDPSKYDISIWKNILFFLPTPQEKTRSAIVCKTFNHATQSLWEDIFAQKLPSIDTTTLSASDLTKFRQKEYVLYRLSSNQPYLAPSSKKSNSSICPSKELERGETSFVSKNHLVTMKKKGKRVELNLLNLKTLQQETLLCPDKNIKPHLIRAQGASIFWASSSSLIEYSNRKRGKEFKELAKLLNTPNVMELYNDKIFMGFDNGYVIVYDLKNEQSTLRENIFAEKDKDKVVRIHCTEDGVIFIGGNGQLCMYDHDLIQTKIKLGPCIDKIDAVASCCNRLFVSRVRALSGCQLCLWQLDSNPPKSLQESKWKNERISCITFFDPNHFFTGTMEGNVDFWNIETFKDNTPLFGIKIGEKDENDKVLPKRVSAINLEANMLFITTTNTVRIYDLLFSKNAFFPAIKTQTKQSKSKEMRRTIGRAGFKW